MAASVIETCHVACSANRAPNVVSWGRGGLIAFGSCNSVCLYDPQEGRVVGLLNGHTGRVNAVRWVHRTENAPECHLVSGGSDSRLILWEAQHGKFIQSVECKGHTAAVCAVDAVYTEDSKVLVASSASDSTVRLWLCSDDKDAECLHIVSFAGFMMAVSLALLPGTKVPVLACGGDDCKVHLYAQANGQLQKVMTLQGHEDWVRGVEWTSAGAELLLASCSQDSLIRVWRLCAKSGTDTHAEDDHTIIKMKEDVFEVKDRGLTSVFAASLETVLAGHENWVYGVHWHPPVYKGGELQQPLCLLSASMDKTMIIWAPEEASGVWVEQVRVGEVGGNTLGFYGCQMSPDGAMIVAHAFQGALHLWCKDHHNEGEWRPGVVVSGHFDVVQDLSWDPEGEFILTVGSDQTTRLFTPWKKQNNKEITWHEISRPQIHGYDMQCLAMVGRFQFVSGADEKVLRVFQAPRNFVENFATISGASKEKLLTTSDAASLPEGASTPALGLSNKAVFQGGLVPKNNKEEEQFNSISDQYQESYFHPLILTEPPPEDHLLQNTLWPEVQKLYGHGFEMFCLASDSTRTLVASACKASKAEHAAVLLWSTTTWRQLQRLQYHTLTVTQMAFSPDAQLLLAVSRDRTWSLWRRNPPTSESSEPRFSLQAHTGKDTAVHSRIIWSCDWSPDSKYFVTSSRDKKVIVWGPWRPESSGGSEIKPCSSVLDVGDSATAVAFCPVLCSDDSHLLAVGLDCGRILLFRWTPGQDVAAGGDWVRSGETDSSQSHTLAVKRLRWRPRAGRAGVGNNEVDGQTGIERKLKEESSWVQLASASADHSVKIFSLNKHHLQ
ncbi:elongator complex protein 2 [Nothobranchius furzeri]|uniref:Elongator complex protein 2 n=2 Tax=Nothobranchius furzeri TaxID=105023 RepID=A0A1A7ZXH6_NOTFU|nr:elongator complex protein 2 [Nothobranchius furzeri]KAF7210717.1 elongator acetyltransferase complex subunit 2 [Nothobranchius furzeri]